MAEDLRPVVVGLSGGLGNQMFQYAAGRALSLRLGCDLTLDLSWFEGRNDRHYALAPFAISGRARSGAQWLPPALRQYATRASRRWGNRRMGAPVFREPHFHFAPSFNAIDEAVFLEGFWQSARYFEQFRAVLLKDFQLKGAVPDSCIGLLQDIVGSESICVHVRRGDYVSNLVAAKAHGLCSIKYYRQAVEALTHDLKEAHCFIFSDDPTWVRQHLHFDCRSTVVDVNDAQGAHWDLFLMAACQHFVIANSSLSWWGAWLGGASNKKVIAPARWFLSSNKNTEDLIPSEWQRL
jgi:hypothetical protein